MPMRVGDVVRITEFGGIKLSTPAWGLVTWTMPDGLDANIDLFWGREIFQLDTGFGGLNIPVHYAGDVFKVIRSDRLPQYALVALAQHTLLT